LNNQDHLLCRKAIGDGEIDVPRNRGRSGQEKILRVNLQTFELACNAILGGTEYFPEKMPDLSSRRA
jgi:hypothetical protein